MRFFVGHDCVNQVLRFSRPTKSHHKRSAWQARSKTHLHYRHATNTTKAMKVVDGGPLCANWGIHRPIQAWAQVLELHLVLVQLQLHLLLLLLHVLLRLRLLLLLQLQLLLQLLLLLQLCVKLQLQLLLQLLLLLRLLLEHLLQVVKLLHHR